MKTQIVFLTLLMVSVFCFSGCQKDEVEPELQITLKDVSDITETSFVINWALNRAALKSISIDVASNSSFSTDLKTIKVVNTANTSQKVDNLHGATTYYFRVHVTIDDGTKKTSYSKTATTNYTSEAVEFFTTDGIRISGIISYLTGDGSKKPGIILLDGYGQNKSWMDKDIFLRFLASGYVCCTFDWRGHGDSDDWVCYWTDNLDSLEIYVYTHALNDLKACHEYFKGHELVDPDRLALIGSSLGATESLNGNGLPGIKASVAMSGFTFGLHNTTKKNVFLIACEEDNTWYGNCAELAQSIYNNAVEPKKLLILPGYLHGHKIFMMAKTGEEVKWEIIDWINERMNDR